MTEEIPENLGRESAKLWRDLDVGTRRKKQVIE
jgi:hypothetical protein